MIGMLTALLTYLIGPLSVTAPAWFVILFVVSALFALKDERGGRSELWSSQGTCMGEVVAIGSHLGW